jgi:CsoR family transcriptional regulator, copper-sensing transcriptional repressor
VNEEVVAYFAAASFARCLAAAHTHWGWPPIPSGGNIDGMETLPGYRDTKDDLLKRLRRIEGQIRGLHRMVETDTYCIDVLTQVSAATRALQSVAVGLLDEHLRHCVADAVTAGGEETDRLVTEASRAIERLVKS